MTKYRDLIDRFEAGGQKLRAAVSGLTREEALARPGPGEWSIQELVVHLADGDTIAVDRMKRIITEENPTLLRADERAYVARLHSEAQSLEDAVTLVDLNRRQFARVLRELDDCEFERFGTHSGELGRITLAGMIKTYSDHLHHHLKFLEAKLARLRLSLSVTEASPQPRRVLVTGAAGAIGQIVCRWLRKRGHHVRGFDLRPTEGLEDSIIGDLSDRAKVQAAAEGMETIVHLAARPDDGDFINDLFEPNVRGLFDVCDAARQSGAGRLILASSLQVVEGHGWDAGTIRVEDALAPTNHYALTKAWAELLGEMYARCYGLSVISVRIGWLPRNTEEARRLANHAIGPAVYLSHDDAKHFFERCVESPTPGPSESAVVFATSHPPDREILDLAPAHRVIGYEPKDTWPQGLPFPVE